jgi:WS/DGAT/MGAT family acyltransferase
MSEAVQNDETNAELRQLSGQDAVFIYGETPSMPMHTMGTTILDPSGVPGGFGFEQIAATVAARIHRIPPFRQRLLEVPFGLGHPLLVDDPDFRVENHLHRIALPAPGGMRELAEVVGDLAGRLLERSQPLWEMWVVEGLEGGRIALVAKLHHCMIDGASGSSQMANLMDLEPDVRVESAPPWNPPPLPATLPLVARSVGSGFVGPLQLGRLLFSTARGLRARRRVRSELAQRDGRSPAFLQLAPSTPMNGAVTTHRKVAYGSVPLDEVKRIKNAFGVTVNDAALAASALALRRYLQARDALPEEPLVCGVPISLKSETEKQELSNKVSLMSVRLPTHLDDPEAIVQAVERATADAKRVHLAAADDLAPRWLQLAPPLLTTLGARLYSDWDVGDLAPVIWNVVVSNMRGPPVPLYFGGARVEAVYPMGPVGEGFGLNITLLSNMGRLDVGVLACRELVPDPWEITEGLVQAVAELGLAARKKEGASPQPGASP